MLLILIMSLLSACSLLQDSKKVIDPYEGFNRKVYSLNDTMVRYVAKPIVKLYKAALPQGARNGVQNFFDNIGTVADIANDALQLNPRLFWQHSVRLTLNTTLGILGFVDVANEAGFKPVEQSFGLTLAGWGYEDSAYLVLPFYGPSTVRETIGKVPDFFMSPLNYIHPERDRYLAKGADLTQILAQTVPQYETLTETALDPYVAVRNAYLQRQKHLLEQIKLGGLEVEVLKDPLSLIHTGTPFNADINHPLTDDHLPDLENFEDIDTPIASDAHPPASQNPEDYLKGN